MKTITDEEVLSTLLNFENTSEEPSYTQKQRAVVKLASALGRLLLDIRAELVSIRNRD